MARKGEQPRAGAVCLFSAALTRLRREGKLALVGQIRAAAAKHDWRAPAWLLERM